MGYWSGDDLNALGLACFLLANLVLLGSLTLAALWWWLRGNRRTGSGWSGPERVLAERFARGDIDDAEYRRRLETLRTASGGPTTNG
jgi:putative membrane protein